MPPRGLTDEEKQAAQDYEYFSMNYHREKYGDDVWHASLIPEEELYAAGVFHNYNSRRLMRNAQFRELEKNKKLDSPYLDDGIDFLIKTPASANTEADAKAIYRVGQSKFYTKRKVPNRELAGFYRNMARMRTSGYLYTSTPLEIGLREDLMNQPDWFTHTLLKYDAGLTAQASSSEPKLFKLRPYQIEAVDTIVGKIEEDPDDAQMILQMGCGLGKTLIATRTIQRLMEKAQNRASSSNDTPPSRLFVCIAPLRISVSNLYYRIMEQISNTPNLVVDSDSYGTTDPDTIRKFLERDRTQIVFATYDSFKTLLMGEFADHLHVNDTFLIVDEAHNLTPEMCEMVNTFGTQLLMSATFPEEVKYILDAKPIYNYGMSRGIQEGYIVDYDVIFPLIKMVPSTETEGKTYVVDVDIPLSFPKDDMTAKSLFLAAGMLEKGSRRCIVYLQKCDECDLFIKRFRDVCEQYHGIRVWSGKMDYTTTSNSRKILLEQFQEKSTNYEFFIMATVRVLDEAVDIPKCDSEFITNVGNTTSDIRTIQRLQRGARLDADNPMKKNHLFLWTENWGRAVNALSMVKEMDPNYHKKIQILSGSYDTIGKTETNVELKLMNSKLTQYISIRCETSDERWSRMFEELKKYYLENGHLPSYHTCEDKYKVLANWVTSQKRRILRNDTPLYQRENLLGFKEINEWFIKIQTVGKTEKLVWNECFPLLKDYIDTNNKIPVITYKTDDGFKLGIWTFAQKMGIKKHRLTDIQLNKLLELKPIKEWHKSYLLKEKIVMSTWDEMYSYLVEYINKNNKLPTALYVLDNSIRLGSWLTTQKHKVTHKLIVPNRLSKLMEIKSFKKWYDSSLTRVIKPVISWDESFERYRQYIIKNNTLCPQLFVESDGWRIGYWQDVQKRNIFKNMENERKTRLLSLEVFRKWYETNPKYIAPDN